MISSKTKKSLISICLSASMIVSMGGSIGIYFAYADDTEISTENEVSSTPEKTTNSVDPPIEENDIASTTEQLQVATSTETTGGISSYIGGTVLTGDSIATTTISNELNTNTTNPDEPGETNSSTITASTTNDGTIISVASSTSVTGDNTVIGGESENRIESGSAFSTANVINVVNTNIFNSNGLILFLNQLLGGGLDLNQYDLSYFFNGGPGASEAPNSSSDSQPCTILTCLNSSGLNVYNTNTAQVTNSVIARASTGNNMASSTGDSEISTGDAYAAANVLNLVNTNFINSSYLLISFNNFGNLTKDITFPNSGFFNEFLSQGGSLPELNSSTYTASNNNFGTTTASTTAEALTGNNEIIGTASSTEQITTGQAVSFANTFNQENTNLFGGASIFMLFRVWGNWTGNIQGLPDGILWQETQNGIELISSNSATTDTAQGDTCEYTNHTLTGGPCFNSSSFLASSTNNATLENNVHVYALTGENQATSSVGTSTIQTGDAYAVANVVNLVNTNVIGRNWIFAIFNIFGDWSGNIAFGQPNLWLGAMAKTSNPTPPDSDVTYELTIKNEGVVEATNVLLNLSLEKNTILIDSKDAISSNNEKISWNLGTIPSGATRIFNFTGHVPHIPTGTSLSVPITANVSSNQNDGDILDNTDIVTIVVSSPTTGSGGGGGGGIIYNSSGGGSNFQTIDPKITITKTANVSMATAPATINYQVIVNNEKSAGPLYKGILTDTLSDPGGNIMYSRSWNLEGVAPGDEIKLDYSVEYSSTTLSGLYNNVASISGYKNSPSYFLGGSAINPIYATGTVVFVSSDGDFGTTSLITFASSTISKNYSKDCKPFLTNFLKQGQTNDTTDVAKLQTFLTKVQGHTLPITGFFGPLTTSAVKKFQNIYIDDILTPVGVSSPTGIVREMTLSKINHIMCGWPETLAIKITKPDQNTNIPKTKTVAKTTKIKVSVKQENKKTEEKTSISPIKPETQKEKTPASVIKSRNRILDAIIPLILK